MLLDLLAHEERLRLGAARERRACDRVGAHRHPADRARPPVPGLRGDQLGERLKAVGAQDRALGVDQVLRGLSAGQHHLADHERVLSQLREQPLAWGEDPSSRVHDHRPGSSYKCPRPIPRA